MQQKLCADKDKKVLSQMQAAVSPSASVMAMRCRCLQSRRITNVLMDCERRNRKRMRLNKEYKLLRDCVPSIAGKPVDKLTIINEAVSLIDRLELAVIDKLQSKQITKFTLPDLNALRELQLSFECLNRK